MSIEKQKALDTLKRAIKDVEQVIDDDGIGEIRATLKLNFGSDAKSEKYRGFIKPENESGPRTFPMFWDVLERFASENEALKAHVGRLKKEIDNND